MAFDKNMLGIISSIYDTILNPDVWLLIGKKIRDRYSSDYAGLYVYNVETGDLVHDAVYGVDESFTSFYTTKLCFMGPCQKAEQFIAQNPNIPLTDPSIDELFFSIERRNEKQSYFGEHWEKYNCDHIIGSMIDLPGHLRAGIFAIRSPSIGAFKMEEKQDFEPIRKAFQQAMVLSKHINQLDENTSALEQTIHFINQAAFIIDSQCRVLARNRAANRHLKDKTILCDINGKLSACADRHLNNQLIDAMTLACHKKSSKKSSITRKMPNGPLELLICPVKNKVNLFSHSHARALVLLLEGKVSCPRVLADIYQLSYSEKQVTKLALKGLCIKEIAVTKGNSPETIKTHLRNIYSKTHTRNLQELRQLVRPMPNLP